MVLALLGSKVGSEAMARTSPLVASMTMAVAPMRGELLHRGRDLALDHALQAEIDGELQRLAALQLLVEEALDAGQAGIVDAGIAQDVRGGGALRIDAALLGLEFQARNAQAIDPVVLARAQARA